MSARKDLPHLLGMNREALADFLENLGCPSWRASQVLKWLYHQRQLDPGQMFNLSKLLRAEIALRTRADLPEILSESLAEDGVRKWLMRPASSGDVGAIETVLIPDGARNTLCVSSQVGCALGCTFCATGRQGFSGDLHTADIVAQVWIAEGRLRELGDARGVTNIVFMGMGEPLLNFEAVMRAVDLMIDDCAFGLANHRVTISTAGVVPGIRDMQGRTSASLAISLHAPDDALRSRLVPVNRKYGIDELLQAAREYLATLGPRRRLTMEYTLIRGVNDSVGQAKALARLLRNIRCNINLIPFNPIVGSGFERPQEASIRAFQRVLLQAGCSSIVRRTRGDEINAACGQLVGELSVESARRRPPAERLESELIQEILEVA
jgi:23S rRNA (adenine2503-C2)-methyltransferase